MLLNDYEATDIKDFPKSKSNESKIQNPRAPNMIFIVIEFNWFLPK